MHVFECINKALSPISELTDFLSGECHVTISSVVPVLHNLKTKILIVKEEDVQLTKDIKKNIIDDLDSQYTDSNIQHLLHTPAFLDPSFKADFSANKEDLKALISKQAMEILEEPNPPEPDDHSTPKSPSKKKRRNCCVPF